MNKICTRVHLNTSKSPSGYYEITKYGPNDSPISKLVDVINHETYDFGKPASSDSGILLNPLHQKIISILAQGNSTQASGSVPKYICQGSSVVENGQIKSISSITLGGHTVSVDLRSAGSVYDEWASNGHGTRKVGIVDLTSKAWTYDDGLFYTSLSDCKNGTTKMLSTAGYTAVQYYSQLTGTDKTIYSDSNGNLYVHDNAYTDAPTFTAAAGWLTYELKNSSSFTAGSPLTLASGLTPTDQDGNAVTFTEGTEATPSPNYPVPIVNSSLISITDGQDTNSASIDLAGLTDKDQVYVNVKSTNIWDEEYETGRYNNTTGAKEPGDGTRIRNKTPIPCKESQWYYRDKTKVSNIYFYDAEGTFLSYFNDSSTDYFETPAGCAFISFFTTAAYGSTYKDDINISETSQNVPVPYMPHNTKGKVWHKALYKLEDMGNLSYDRGVSAAGNIYFDAQIISDMKPQTLGTPADVLCTDFTNYTDNRYPTVRIHDNVYAVGNGFTFYSDYYDDGNVFKTAMTGQKILYPLKTPTWSDITSSAMGAALLAMETYQADSNTASVDNGGQSNVEYWKQM